MSAAASLPTVRASVVHASVKAPVERDRGAVLLPGGTVFYRRRTEAMLSGYMHASLAVGRAPSLLGNSVFRGRASSSRLRTFEDAIIFVFDMEKCLKRLDVESRELIARIALQEYTHEETAQLTGQSERTVGRKYAFALDQLTNILLEVGLLESGMF
jgi:Sigma-70, region 4